MLVYTSLTVQLHGLYRSDLKGLTRQEIAEKVKKTLLIYFEFDCDVEVEVTESAGK